MEMKDSGFKEDDASMGRLHIGLLVGASNCRSLGISWKSNSRIREDSVKSERMKNVNTYPYQQLVGIIEHCVE